MAYRYFIEIKIYWFLIKIFLDGKKLSVEFSNENEIDFAIEKKTSNYSLNNEKENLINEREKEFMRSKNKNKKKLRIIFL